jgi:hypothetical protein
MRTPALISLVTLFALPLAASAQIYSWKDASGKVHYSDKPPIEKKVQTRELKSGKASGGETAAPASKERTGDGTAPGKGEGGANGTTAKNNADQALEEAEARQKLCDNARKRLIQLEATGGVLLTKNEKGEQVPLVGGARKAETEAARKDVEQWCK